MYSLIISTIGSPFINDTLRTMEKFPPKEVIVVVDVLGRSVSNLESVYPLAKMEADLAASPVKPRVVYYHPTPSAWAVMNGCYNLGAKHATRDYYLFTHDDVLFNPDFDYPSAISKVLRNVEADGRQVMGKNIKGICIPEYEILNQVVVPMYGSGPGSRSGSGKDWCLCQVYSPVSHIIHKSVLEELGGFDEDFGIWYDGQMQIESFQRDWWYIHLPTPLLTHESVKTYRINNWGNNWSVNPKWGEFPTNFARKYPGITWERNCSLLDGIPITEERFGL